MEFFRGFVKLSFYDIFRDTGFLHKVPKILKLNEYVNEVLNLTRSVNEKVMLNNSA
jgi:hypothetical protein